MELPIGGANFNLPTKNCDESKLCAVCNEKIFKYKCPGCLTKTCSIECVKVHKNELDCDGKQVKIPFKKIEDFDDKQFFKDFNFLEEGSRLLDCLKRDRQNIIKSKDQLPPWLKKLVYEARCRGTRLKILPAGFEKRNKSKTTFMYDKKEILWDIELIFTHITVKGNLIEKPSSITLNRMSEKKTLSEIIQSILNPTDIMERINLWKFLTSYRLTDPSSIVVLLSNGKKFHEVDMNQNLAKILECKTIVEYPTFVVTLTEFKDLFPIETNEEKIVANEDGSKLVNGQNSNGKGRYQNNKRKNRKGKRKFGKGLKSHVDAKIPKTSESDSNRESCAHSLISEASSVTKDLDTSAIKGSPMETVEPNNSTKNINSCPLSASFQVTKTGQHDSDVSSLSTSDDEDYQSFVNIGFSRSSSGV